MRKFNQLSKGQKAVVVFVAAFLVIVFVSSLFNGGHVPQ